MIYSKHLIALFPLLLIGCVTPSEDPASPISSTWEDCENGVDYLVPSSGIHRVKPSDLGLFYSRPQTAPNKAMLRQKMGTETIKSSASKTVGSNTKNQESLSNAYITGPATGAGVDSRYAPPQKPVATERCSDGSYVEDAANCPIPPIYGGNLADHHFHPWAAHLSMITKKSAVGESVNNFCGAAIISNEWLLTAAHCVSSEFLQIAEIDRTGDPMIKLDVVEIQVKMGRSHLEDPEILQNTIAEKHCHSGFNPETLENDIALLRLATPIAFSQLRPSIVSDPTAYMRKGTLPEQASDPLNQQNFQQQIKTVGWGLTDFYSSGVQVSPQLIEATMAVDPNSVSPSSNQFNSIPDSNGTYACAGDSGSPVTLLNGNPSNPDSHLIVGINSSITGNTSNTSCSGSGITTFFTRVSNYREQIDELISP